MTQRGTDGVIGAPPGSLAGPATGPQALEEYRVAIRDTARLNRLFALLGEAAPLPVVADRVLLALSELFAADVVALFELEAGGQLRPLGVIGLPETEPASRFSGDEGSHAAAAIRSRRPVLVPAARTDPALDRCLREVEVEVAAWLPVMGGNGVLGLLLLARCQPLPFARAEVDLVMAMAHRLGLALERARAEEVRQQLEVRLQHTEKVESLGRMAAAIAHHFNNKLSAVLSSLDLARQGLPADHPSLREIDYAQEAARQASMVSGLMLTYLGQGASAREAVDLVAACRDALATQAGAAAAGVRIVTAWPAEPLPVRAHPASLRQVLGNLVANALEALPEAGGEVRVALDAVAGAEVVASPLLMPDWAPRAPRYARLQVSDDGCGIERSAVSKLFDPFYTTRFAGRGLGLPVVLGIVRAHQGTLSLVSEPGRGSTFRVYLPLTDEVPPQVRAPVAGASPPTLGPGLALVVDDEPLIRRATARLLVGLGFEVAVAADGVEALERFRERAGEVRVVVLDVTMPRLDGWATLEALRALRPGLPVILASGYDEARVMSGDHPERPQAFLQKPFDVADLEATIRAALAAEGGG